MLHEHISNLIINGLDNFFVPWLGVDHRQMERVSSSTGAADNRDGGQRGFVLDVPEATRDVGDTNRDQSASCVLDPTGVAQESAYHRTTQGKDERDERRSRTQRQSTLDRFFTSSRQPSPIPIPASTVPSMRPLTNKWCHTRGTVTRQSLLSISSQYIFVEDHSTTFVNSFEELLTEKQVASLYQNNVFVREFLIDVSSHRLVSTRNVSCDIRDSRTTIVASNLKLTYLFRLRMIVQRIAYLFRLITSDPVQWRFDYMLFAGMEDVGQYSIEDMQAIAQRISITVRSPPRHEDDDYAELTKESE
jgi:hypothetical protein